MRCSIAAIIARHGSLITPYSTRQSCRQEYVVLARHDGRFERMLDTLQTLPIPRVDAEQVRRWFGEVKEFPNIDLFVQIVNEGAPVPVTGKGDLKSRDRVWESQLS